MTEEIKHQASSIKENQGINQLYLNHNETLIIKKLLQNGPLSDKDLFEEYFYIAEILKSELSQSSIDTLNKFKESDDIALLIKGLPIDDFLVTTPATGYLPNWATPIAIRVQFAIYGLLNIIPVVYSGENRTKLVRHVVPVASSSKKASSQGYDVTFAYHVDNPDLPLMSEPNTTTSGCPEYLSLYGVRGDYQVPTTIVSLSEVLGCLTKNDLYALAAPEFSIQRPASFDENQTITKGLPLITFDEKNGWLCRLDVENVKPETSKAEATLERLTTLLNTRRFDQNLVLNNGDFLIFKNQKALHMRQEFSPKFDGQDRWLMRMFGLNTRKRLIPVSSDLPYVCQS